MAKLIMWNMMTLDGFVEGPNRDLSWHLDVWGEELERLSIEQGKNAGGLMFGRLTYDLMARHWPKEKGEGGGLHERFAQDSYSHERSPSPTGTIHASSIPMSKTRWPSSKREYREGHLSVWQC